MSLPLGSECPLLAQLSSSNRRGCREHPGVGLRHPLLLFDRRRHRCLPNHSLAPRPQRPLAFARESDDVEDVAHPPFISRCLKPSENQSGPAREVQPCEQNGSRP